MAKMLKRKRKFQSTVEYGILLSIVVAALVAMQVYVKRAIQAKHKDAADLLGSVGGQVTFDDGAGNTIEVTLNQTAQYEPEYLQRHTQQNLTTDYTSKSVYSGGRAVTDKTQNAEIQSAVVYGYDPDAAD